ncbi:MAG: extracellular solute-binding protein [Bifidobacteriaceae bacterium]|jgi:ABC-type glycerol-3-phosphate transport system substrate-binding protein|nr:extracellular solute-binding protein [Bifidobacteriaceae bacterium]
MRTAQHLRTVIAFAAAVTLAMTVAACGGDDAGSTSSSGGDTTAAGSDGGDSASAASPETASSVTGEVAWWGWTPDKDVGDNYIKEFNKVYPNIKVTFKNFENTQYKPSLRAALAAGEGPDVWNVAPGGDTGGVVLYADYVEDLTQLATNWLGPDYATKWTPGFSSNLTLDGKLTGAPLGGVAAGFLWINQTLFDQYGLKAPTTLQEWVDVCKTFNDAGIICYGLGSGGGQTFASELLRVVLNSIDPDFFLQACQGQREWNEPIMVEAIGIMRQMQADGIIEKDTVGKIHYPDSNNDFMSQRAAMNSMGTWYAQYSRKSSAIASMEAAGVSNPEPFVMVPVMFPNLAGNDWTPQLFAEVDYGLAVNKDSKNKEAAEIFVAWLTMTEEGSRTVMNALDLTPSLVGVEADWEQVDLVDNAVQKPAIQELFGEVEKIAQVESRQKLQTAETLQALVVGVEQILGTTVDAQAIADQIQTDSTVSPLQP